MKNLLSIILVAITTVGVAQDSTKFSFGLDVFPHSSHAKYTYDDDSFLYDEGSEIEKLSLGVSAFVEYSLNSKLAVNLGVGYLNNGQRSTKIAYTYGGQIDLQTGFMTGGEEREIQFYYVNEHIEIPLHLKYQFWRRYYTQVGGSGVINMKNTTITKTWIDGDVEASDRVLDNSPFTKVNVYLNASVGAYFREASRVQTFLQLYGQYALMPVYESAKINRQIIAAGFSIGVKFN